MICRSNQTNRIFSFPERSGCSPAALSRSPMILVDERGFEPTTSSLRTRKNLT